MFPLRLQNLAFFDLRFGFLVKNCVYSHLDRSGIPKFGQNPIKLIKKTNIFINLNVGLLYRQNPIHPKTRNKTCLNNKFLRYNSQILVVSPRFPPFFPRIPSPKLEKIQTLAKIYQFLIELPGCTLEI